MLTDEVDTGNIDLVVSVNYTFTEAGKEVSRMFSFAAENQEQYEQYNRALHSGMLA